MAGHSQFSNIKHRKSAQDQKKSRKFTQIRREIFVAAKSGAPDIELNNKLRVAVFSARKNGFPRDKIEETIKSASSKTSNENYDDVTYEAYGPHGIAIIISSLTDNRNRTASDLRTALSRHSGSLGEPGSVSFLFDELGYIQYPLDQLKIKQEDLFDYAIEIGALDFVASPANIRITCFSKDFGQVRDMLHQSCGQSDENGLFWKPKTLVALNDEASNVIRKLLTSLEDFDDVQSTFSNAMLESNSEER